VDVGDGWFAPGEMRVVVRADQRDVLRHPQPPALKELLRRIQQRCLLEDQGGGRCYFEQRIEYLMETLGAVIPVGQVVGAGRDAVRLEFLEKGALGVSRLREPLCGSARGFEFMSRAEEQRRRVKLDDSDLGFRHSLGL
jgi:hypothetical protein